jgi:hypothetical protein
VETYLVSTLSKRMTTFDIDPPPLQVPHLTTPTLLPSEGRKIWANKSPTKPATSLQMPKIPSASSGSDRTTPHPPKCVRNHTRKELATGPLAQRTRTSPRAPPPSSPPKCSASSTRASPTSSSPTSTPEYIAPVTPDLLFTDPGAAQTLTNQWGQLIKNTNYAIEAELQSLPNASRVIYYDVFQFMEWVYRFPLKHGFTAPNSWSMICDNGVLTILWTGCITDGDGNPFMWINYVQPTSRSAVLRWMCIRRLIRSLGWLCIRTFKRC